MSDNDEQPIVSEVDVQMPEPRYVYYDSVLETVMTVHEVSDDFVTYIVEGEVDNVNSDPTEKFLAWLAAERFIKLGERDDEGNLIVGQEELNEVMKAMYGTNVASQNPYDMAAVIVENEVDVQIELIV